MASARKATKQPRRFAGKSPKTETRLLIQRSGYIRRRELARSFKFWTSKSRVGATAILERRTYAQSVESNFRTNDAFVAVRPRYSGSGPATTAASATPDCP